MAGIGRTQNDVLVDANILSQKLLEPLQNGFLPESLTADISAFQSGDILTVPTRGEMIVRDVDPDVNDLPVDDITTGSVTLAINKFKSAGTAINDKFREDSGQLAEQMVAGIPRMALLSLSKAYESDMLTSMNIAQTANNANNFNGIAHRRLAIAANNFLSLEDVALMKYSLDELGAGERRVLLIPSIGELAINKEIGGQAFVNNPEFGGIVNTGISKSMRFLKNIHGFDIWVTSRSPSLVAELSSGEAVFPCMAFSIDSDDEKPVMSAWRRRPRITGERQEGAERDVFWGSSRYGFATQRKEAIVTTLVSQVNYK